MAGLADLAGAPAETESTAGAPAISNPDPADENQDRGAIAAKAAKPESVASWGQAKEARAAIIEHDGLIPRAWEEEFARLHRDLAPASVPASQWPQFIEDADRFLGSDFAAVTTALGWGPYDLFGCDLDRPSAWLDRAGLLWLLAGDQLVALTQDVAVIETRTGAPQTYRRRPTDPGRALVWELAR